MIKVIYSILTIGFLFLVSSCEQSDCDCDGPPDLRPITAGEQEVIESANGFAFDIFSKINQAEQGKNLFISPLSISTALSMTANGAAGDTKEGIKETLHQLDLTDQEINEAYKTLIKYITDLDPKVTMNLANSNWFKQEYSIREEFRTILEDFYDAEVKGADFSDPVTKDLINNWIEDKTNGMIKDMLDQIPSNAVMYLINAIYLKATWQFQFDKESTGMRDFTLENGNVIQTNMMFSEGVKVSSYSNTDLTFVELPYGNGQFVFSIVLPHNESDLDAIIHQLDVDQFNNFIEESDTITAQVYLPKFKIGYKKLLNEVLSEMGMAESFTGQADFSDLIQENLALAISRVIHQAVIEVDEEGTEAAAATIVEIVETSAGIDPKPTFFIDKPFAFFIREKHSEAIIFSGKLVDPRK